MIEEQGVVVALDGDYARVQTLRGGACGGCSADGACGTSLLDRFLGRRTVLLRARNAGGAAVGDRVLVGVSESGLVRAAMAAYLVPVGGLLIGAVAGQWVGGVAGDLWSLVGALSGFLLALFWLRRYSAASAREPGLHPVVLRRLDGGPHPISVTFLGH